MSVAFCYSLQKIEETKDERKELKPVKFGTGWYAQNFNNVYAILSHMNICIIFFWAGISNRRMAIKCEALLCDYRLQWDDALWRCFFFFLFILRIDTDSLLFNSFVCGWNEKYFFFWRYLSQWCNSKWTQHLLVVEASASPVKYSSNGKQKIPFCMVARIRFTDRSIRTYINSM